MAAKLKKSNEDENVVDTTCGIGSWRPEWLQFFASPLFFLINISLVGIIQAMTGPLYASSMSTFEKRQVKRFRIFVSLLTETTI